MIGNALGAEIATYAVEMRRSNPLFTKAMDGTLSADRIAHYLANIHYLIRYTPIYLARARDRAFALGDTQLAAHYQHKRGEEVGHDIWAERDIERVSVQAIKPVLRDVMPAIRALVDYLAKTIDEDPALYLSYILFTEQLIVILGPEWLMLLEDRCGIPRSSMTVIDNHAELDKEHVEEALEQIDALVADPRKLPAMRGALRASIAFFNQFCAQITSAEDRHDADTSRDVAAHVSAA